MISHTIVLLLPVVFLLTCSITFAQERTSTDPQTLVPPNLENEDKRESEKDQRKSGNTTNGGNVEKIQVTGSYIKRTDVEGPSPVLSIDNESFLERGSYTLGDTLKENPLFSNVSSGAFLSFHGQTDADNLVLLNGLRIPKTAGGSAVNIDFLPASAIKNVEILKDGASALYGSEALAGVININTKRDYDGINLMTRATVPEKGVGQQYNVVGTIGHSTSKWNILGVLQFRQSGAYTAAQAGEYLKGPNGGIVNSPYGNFIDDDGVAGRGAGCPPDKIDSRGVCSENILDRFQYAADTQHISALVSSSYTFNSSLSWDSMLLYTRRSWEGSSFPVLMDFNDNTASGGTNDKVSQVQSSAWDTVPDIANNGNSTRLLYLPTEELGNRISTRDVDSYLVQTALKGYLSNTWEWNLSGGYGLTAFEDRLTRGNALRSIVVQKLNNGAFNPTKPFGSKDSLEDARAQTWFQHTSDIYNTKLVAAGEIYDFNSSFGFGGPVSLAVGTEGQWQSFKFNNDPLSNAGLVFTDATSNQSGSRQVSSGFMELTGYPLETVELQLAGRFDQYSDVGGTFNPKYALSWKPNNTILFRSSYGTGFKAPDLLSVFQSTSTQFEQFRDEVICRQNGENDPNCQAGNYYRVTTTGNRKLRPEMAEHFNFGTVIEPGSGLSIVIDYWGVNGREGLSDINIAQLTEAEANMGSQFFEGINTRIVRDPTTNVIQSVSVPTKINAGIFAIRGLDLEFNFDRRVTLGVLGPFNFFSSFYQSHILSSKGNTFPFEPITGNFDIDWKNTTSAGITNQKHLYKISARTIAGSNRGFQNSFIGAGSHRTHTEYDIHYAYTAPWKAQISFGIKNIFNLRSPMTDHLESVRYVSPSAYQILGRTYYLSYGQDF